LVRFRKPGEKGGTPDGVIPAKRCLLKNFHVSPPVRSLSASEACVNLDF
jgi:hypothetical protein